MRLLTLTDVGFTWRHPTLLDNIQLAIDTGERIGLLGRNGAGKSTLMKIIAGEIKPDHGEVIGAPKLRVARLIQEVPEDVEGSIESVVLKGFPPSSNLDIAANSSRPNAPSDESDRDQHWHQTKALDRILSRMQLDGERPFETLSSGMKRRVLLAQTLISEPDILLLDEPTNHLDIDSIIWLENFLAGYRGTFVFVTHDRMFLQALATRILEIDRGQIFDWACNYQTFLARKAAMLDAEEKQQALFDKRLAQEEAWIRQGIKARRTRNEGRVRALEAMRRQRSERREKVGNVRMQAVSAEQSGALVLEAKDIEFSYSDKAVIKNFSTLITRGDKIGVIGPNGAGKSTLLKLLLGELKPTAGTIRYGTKLEPLYFDQLRQQIDPERDVAWNVGEGNDQVVIHGQPRHIYGYLQDFLFTPDRARQPAKFLSGGERNRLLLAKLFKHPSNLLILDEPTNDLDAETLELLEELVGDYAGTLLLVSHDRAFLNNVVTSVIAVEGDGSIKEYGGGYDDYARSKQLRDQEKATSSSSKSAPPKAIPNTTASKPAKLSFKEQKELEQLPGKIDAIEREQSELHSLMSNPDFYRRPPQEIAATTARLSQLDLDLVTAYQRLEEMENRL